MKRIIFLLSVILTVSCAEKQIISVVPYPNDVTMTCGTFDAAGADFRYGTALDEASKALINDFAAQLSLVSGQESAISEGVAGKGFSFVLEQDMPKEAYSITVKRKSVEVRASGLNGFNYAIQTLKQMLPTAVFGSSAAPGTEWDIPCCRINDAPRFGYRGMHLDVSRHFFGIDEVKRYLDIMEVHKLNTLHWHLTDDQGWRIEIKKYPRLTEVGSVRKGTCINKDWDSLDGIPHGGYYTQEQIREVISYAAAKGITIIPEIDLPGHMLAAVTAYPQYGCTGGPYEVWTRWGISDDVLCVGKEETMKFLEDILSEVADLFPSEYIHIGGDECPKVRWETCPRCQAKIRELGLKDDEAHKAEHYLQSYVTARVEEFLATKGKKIIGWDEILEGELAPNATVMSWRGVRGGIEAVRMGHDAIMTPNTYYYLDYYQSLDTDNEPFGIGGYLPIEKCYSYEPFVKDMTDEEKSHVLGVQANLWTEYIATADHLYYMMLPRMAALSEVQWCNQDRKDWERFRESADEFCAIYDTMGYNYAKHIFNTTGEVRIDRDKGKVELVLGTQGGVPVRYTLDGSDPDESSAIYTEPLHISQSCTVKAVAFRDNMEPKVFSQEFHAHKAMGRPVTLLTEPAPQYSYNAPDNLTDGVWGAKSYDCGAFAGWYNNPFDVMIDMGDTPAYSKVSIGTFIRKGDLVFNPLGLKVSVSDDGKEFKTVAEETYPADGPSAADGCHTYSVTFPETAARYLKVTAATLEAMPEWHWAEGRPGFLFVDEVTVE